MALVNCPECKKEVSDQSRSCPGCGYPIANDSEAQAHRTNNATSSPTIGEKLEAAGKGMQGCGCLLTIFITIPLILFLIFFL